MVTLNDNFIINRPFRKKHYLYCSSISDDRYIIVKRKNANGVKPPRKGLSDKKQQYQQNSDGRAPTPDYSDDLSERKENRTTQKGKLRMDLMIIQL